MNRIATHLILGLTLFFSFNLSVDAQILPPDFLCVKGDTLVWNTPNNNCGPFIGYEIYFSDNPDGPFTLLTTITDENQTEYVHNNPGSQVWYYYLLSDYDCPGLSAFPSDTLDNLIPGDPTLQSVSVVGDDVEISWLPSPSPEVTGYIIYRLIAGNVDIVDTAYTNMYVDTTADPLNRSELYYILALDDCGNTSIFLNPHSTIYLQYELEVCEREVRLDWNLYQNWTEGIGRHEIWVQEGSGNYELYDTVGSMDSTYSFPILLDNQDYCFYIKAVEENTGVEANSNAFCITPDVNQGITQFSLTNATFNDNGEVELSWNWNTDAELSEVQVLRQIGGTSEVIASFPPDDPLQADNEFVDPDPSSTQGPLEYTIQTIDQCSQTAMSNVARTVFLQGFPQTDQSNGLSWTLPDLEGALTTGFELYRLDSGVPVKIADLGSGETSYSDPVDPDEQGSSSKCYYVVASGEFTMPDGQVVPFKRRSNTACIEQLAEIFVPNAFAPRGRNQVFRPVIVFGENADYLLQVFDRYGQLLFESRDPMNGWNGQKDGEDIPQGAYVYRIRLEQVDGRVVEKSGTLVLLR